MPPLLMVGQTSRPAQVQAGSVWQHGCVQPACQVLAIVVLVSHPEVLQGVSAAVWSATLAQASPLDSVLLVEESKIRVTRPHPHQRWLRCSWRGRQVVVGEGCAVCM